MREFGDISNNYIAEPTANAIGSISLSGTDWLGLGEVFGGMNTGTELCGAKPVCVSFGKDSACRAKQSAFNKCLTDSLSLFGQQSSNQQQQERLAKDSSEKRKNKLIITVVAIVSTAALIAFLLLRKKKTTNE